MGTNFSLHLGKRSGLDAGRCAFTWAIPPGLLSLLAPDFPLIEDEYGTRQTIGEFLAGRADDEADYSQVGQWFS